MEWKSPFIIYRISAEGQLQEVFHAEDLKQAKYWLTYIAQPGDVLCKTPAHPKHSRTGKTPEYWSHKEGSGTPMSREDAWKKLAESRKCNFLFPEEQLGETVAETQN